jgi:hypothetical protein
MRGRSKSTSDCLAAVVAFAGLFFSASARADEGDPAAEAGGDEVLVRGRQAGGFVSRARIEDTPRTITDAASLVEPLPGVHVRRLGADDSFATLSIRGSSSTQVAVYLAGVPLSGGADPSLDIATLPLWPGAQARVHRTFAPAALGRGSLGGTLVIDPPSPRAPRRTDVWGAVGSFGALRMRAGDVRGDPDGVRVATGISASRSDDDFTYVDPGATAAPDRDVVATRKNAGHAAASGLVSIGIPVRFGSGPLGALTITGVVQARRQELPGSLRGLTPYQRLDSSRLVSALELTVPAGPGAFGVRGWGRREGFELRDDPLSARSAHGPSATDDAIIAAGGSVGWRGRPMADASLELRLDGSAERFAPGTWVGWIAPPGARRTNAGIALDAGTLVARALTIATSARLDTWLDAADDGPSTTEVRPTGNVGIELPIGPVLAASHAGFVARPPSFVERYGNRGAFIGDPHLLPESAFTVDAGGRIARRLGPVRVRAEAAGFATWAENLITFVYTGAEGRAHATNIGEARLFGIEAEIRAAAFGFEARASHTALKTANGNECAYPTPGVCERPPLPGRPAHDFVADLSWTRGPVRLRYGLDVVAGIVTGNVGDIEVPARVLHGAGIRLAVPRVRGLSLTLDVRNLFDLRVAEYAGARGPLRYPIGDLFDYPLPGRRVLLSAQWTTDAR